MPGLKVISRFLFGCLLWAALALSVSAQTEAPDYDAWERVAQRAEIAVENGRASTSALEAVRAQVADWRERFLAAQQGNQARIETLQSQIAALGTPAEGEEEPAEIVERRDELNAQLQRQRAPRLAAEEAYNRADGVIGEIDGLIRERQTQELIRGGPSPLNPVYWPQAIQSLTASFRALGTEFVTSLGSEAQRRTAVRDLPEVILLAAIGLVLLLRGRRWSQHAANWLRRSVARGGRVWSFFASLLQILLPYLGLTALVAALFETRLIGLRGTLILDNVPLYGLMLLGFWWLGGQLFPRNETMPAILPIAPDRHAQARGLVTAGAAILVAVAVLDILAGYDSWSDETRAVLQFPLLVIAGWILYRLGTLLRTVGHGEEDASESRLFRERMALILGRVAIVIAIAGPLIAAAGYGTAAARLMFSSIMSLTLFGLLLVLQSFVQQAYAYAMRRSPDEDDDALVPVLVGFVIVLAALPLLAMIWGARWADITEVWTRFQEGFAIGDSRISPMDFITFAVIFVIGYLATRLVQGAMRNSVLPRTRIDTGGRNAIVSGIGYVGIFLAAMIAISSAGIDLSSIALVAGALSVGIGFGLQNIVSNFVSGIILLIERPIAEGDWIEVGGKMGYVRGISVRSTRIETFDRTDVIVPNADLVSGMVTNWTRGKTVGRVIVPVGVAYGNDTRKIEDILMAVAREHPMVLMNPAPSVVFQGFGADSLDFEIRAILRDVNYLLSVKSDMNHEIAKRFGEEGIEIPFAQRDIWIRNPEAMMPGAAKLTSDEDNSA